MSEVITGRRWIKNSRIALAFLLLALGAYFNRTAKGLGYSDFGSPGPGFFPYWIGIGLVIAAVIWGLIELRNPIDSQIEQDLDPAGKIRVLRILLAMMALTALYEPLGYNLSIFAFMLILSSTMAKGSMKVNIAVALTLSFGVYWTFENLLDVPLPDSILPFLSRYGL
jgi:putative tricarboxylic transport membrane protein